MANFIVSVGTGNGYTAQKVRINGVTTGNQAKKVVEAQMPGARIYAATPAR